MCVSWYRVSAPPPPSRLSPVIECVGPPVLLSLSGHLRLLVCVFVWWAPRAPGASGNTAQPKCCHASPSVCPGSLSDRWRNTNVQFVSRSVHAEGACTQQEHVQGWSGFLSVVLHLVREFCGSAGHGGKNLRQNTEPENPLTDGTVHVAQFPDWAGLE